MTPDSNYLEKIEAVSFNPIFIMGDHRSGTTILYQTLADTQCFNYVQAYHVIHYDEILSHHFQGQTEEKKQLLQQKFNQIGIRDRKFDSIPVTPYLAEEYGFIIRNQGYERYLTVDSLSLMKELCQKIQVTGKPDAPLLLKNPWCFPHFKFIHQAFPNARFIFIHRNPVHIINSKLKAVDQTLSEWNPYTGLISKKYNQIFRNPFFRAWYRLMYLKSFNLGVNTTLKQSHLNTHTYLQEIESLPEISYRSIRYEDLCNNPRQIMEEILDFAGVCSPITPQLGTSIQARPVKLLPTVAHNQTKIYNTLRPYFIHHQYSLENC